MPLTRFEKNLEDSTALLEKNGLAKGREKYIVRVAAPEGEKGPRFYLEGCGDRACLRMNSNSYLGLSFHPEVIAASEAAAAAYGVGPGAVRFISGTFQPHVQLEKKLAAFHGREDCMITSSAYTAIMGAIVTLATTDTIIISDELNHNCIINATKLARVKEKKVYRHLDMEDLERQITDSIGQCRTLLVVTDGVFSMRGISAPVDKITEIINGFNSHFARDIVLLVDDSHGVGALGATGRGTEEFFGARADVLVGTLGKAFGVNGGYIVSSAPVIRYLREKNPLYIFTNPITPPEAAAALKAVEIADSDDGRARIKHLREMTDRFTGGLIKLGFETIVSEHPVVPLLMRDTEKVNLMVRNLQENGILATGINFPIVPKGDELIRFQICADHTLHDIDYVLSVLASFPK
ncbi:MAG: aminotransferase class I/II-fold pyridoxal phosphate-dependent enzyme [candidate division Zixibacteria bacterium]|nr:aminotransferase class I/II-fold pyridoxal phosphate-dependent enzyme [candidate division Zixibacteria bacterium]